MVEENKGSKVTTTVDSFCSFMRAKTAAARWPTILLFSHRFVRGEDPIELMDHGRRLHVACGLKRWEMTLELS